VVSSSPTELASRSIACVSGDLERLGGAGIRGDDLTAEEVTGKLGDLSQIDLAKVDCYECKNQNRTTVLSRITSLRGNEPWPRYDELTGRGAKRALRR
jgi:hypothetical protein